MKQNDQEALEQEWLRLSVKYGYGGGYTIRCVPNGKQDETLPWDQNTKIRGEVCQGTKQNVCRQKCDRKGCIFLYDNKLTDKLECARHEFFEMMFDEGILQQYVNLCNSFEVTINDMIAKQNLMSEEFMRQCYLKKEPFIQIFVQIEEECCKQNRKVKQK
jgi:hypothetical protein